MMNDYAKQSNREEWNWRGAYGDTVSLSLQKNSGFILLFLEKQLAG